MIRVVKTSFKTSKANLQRLFDTNRISAQVWNDTLKIAKEYVLQNNGKWINKVELQTALKNKYPIHSQSIQAVAHKYLFARKATLEKLEKGLKARYPYKQKKYFNTKWVQKAFKIYPNGKIELSMGSKRQPIIVYVKHLPPSTIKEIELI